MVTLASRPERRPQVASFDVALEKLVAVKVELSSGEDHYFGERAMAVAAEVQQLLQITALVLEEGRLADALAIADRSVKLAADELAAEHPLTICSMASAGDICRRLGRFDTATVRLEAAAERARGIMDTEDPNRAAAIENFAVTSPRLGRRRWCRGSAHRGHGASPAWSSGRPREGLVFDVAHPNAAGRARARCRIGAGGDRHA